MALTIDVGNSRVKWAKWQGGKVIANGAFDYDKENILVSLNVALSEISKPSVVYSVCVAGEEARHVLTQWVKQRWELDVDYLVTAKRFENIVHGYPKPLEHGADRWAAVVAAAYLFPSVPLCVIGAGTATTVDFLRHDGQHLGGYIFPSYTGMYAGLVGGIANINSEQNDTVFNDAATCVKIDAIPVNTNDAVQCGLHMSLQASVQAYCKQAKHVLGDSVRIVITGGFAEMILSYPDMPDMHHERELVMQGLYRIKTIKP